jgi:nicotinamidase-related amidase
MLVTCEHSCLLVIDIQERLMAAVQDSQTVIANSAWLLKIARQLEVPILASEQYPQGLGHTAPELRGLVPAASIMEKTCFSCAADPACLQRINACQREQVILLGAEAHVCVLQTALGLLAVGKDVYVVADCISSRRPRDMELAVERMRAEGVRVVSREMVVFEWLQQAGTDRFRQISREFLR